MKFSLGWGKKRKEKEALQQRRMCLGVNIDDSAGSPSQRATERMLNQTWVFCFSAEEVQLLLPPSLIILFGTDATGRAWPLERVG